MASTQTDRLGTIPLAPTGLTATAVDGGFTLNWTAPAGSILSYTVSVGAGANLPLASCFAVKSVVAPAVTMTYAPGYGASPLTVYLQAVGPGGISTGVGVQVTPLSEGTGTLTVAALIATGFVNAGTIESSGNVTAGGGISAAAGVTAATETISGSASVGSLSATALSLTDPLPVADGGTGDSSLTANGVIIAHGTSAVTTVAPGSSGNVLTSNGTVWASSSPAAAGVTTFNTRSGTVTLTGADVAAAITSLLVVGAIIMAGPNNTSTPTAGNTYAGSTLYNIGTGLSYSASGTWRFIGAVIAGSICPAINAVGAYQRIA